MSHVIIRTGFTTADGREEVLTDYLCDVPGCSNPAVHVVGIVRELARVLAVCAEHIKQRDTLG